MNPTKGAKHTPRPIGKNWGNGLPAQRCAKCQTLCAPEIVDKVLGYCPLCLEPVRAAAPELLETALLMISCIRNEPNPFAKGWGEDGETVEVVDTIKMKEAWTAARAAIAKAEGEEGGQR